MPAKSSDPARIHYLDNLRALAMLLGVYLHGAFAYAEPSRSVWIATNPRGSVAIDVSIWWIHLFRMGLFFLLSGYFAKLMIQRKGLKQFLWNRGIRIVLPFALFWPLLMVVMTTVLVFAFSYVKEPQGLMQMIVAASQNPEAAKSSTPYSTMHLWFLYYLLMFSLIAVVGSHWTRLKFNWLFQRKWLLALSPLALVPGVMGAGLPIAHPSPLFPLGGHLPITGCSIWLAGSCWVASCCWIVFNPCGGSWSWQASYCSCPITVCYLYSTSR